MSVKDVCRLCLSKDNLVWVFDERLDRTDHMKDVILITTGVEAQCREVLKSTDLKIPNTSVRIKTERVENEEIAQQSCHTKPYTVHPTVTALYRKYPKMHLPSISLLSNVDPCVSLELDAVESYFQSRNLKMQRYVQLALRASDKYMPKKISNVAKSPRNNSSEIVANTEQANRISPINIKIKKTGYTIVRSPKADKGDINFVVSSSTQNTNNSDSVEEVSTVHKKKHKKRRHSGDTSIEPKPKKSFSINSSDMILSQPLVQEELATVRNEETPQAFECDICSSKFSSAKHLQNHKEHHLRCMFCKLEFRSVEMKLQHIENSCLVKEAMNNSPDVVVERVDSDLNIRQQFSKTFESIASLTDLKKPAESASDVIEIHSDDEDSSVSTSKSQCGKLETNSIKNNSVSVIKPDVKMKNSNVMDSFDTKTPELKVVTELLANFLTLQSNGEVSTQTELPATGSIEVDKEKFSVDLKSLQQQLHYYQIPIVIRNGSINASYTYQSTPKKPKTMKLWKDLNPIDVTSSNDDRVSNSDPKIAETLPNHSSDATNNVNNDQLSSHTSVHSSKNVSDDTSKRPELISRRNSLEVTPLPQTAPLNTTPLSPIADLPSLKNTAQVPTSFVSSPLDITSHEKSPIQATAPITKSSNSRLPYINSDSRMKSPILAKSPGSVDNLPSITPLQAANYNSVPSNSAMDSFEEWICHMSALANVDRNFNSHCISSNNADSLMHSKPDSIGNSTSFTSVATSNSGARQSATVTCQDMGHNGSTFDPHIYYAKKTKIPKKVSKSRNEAFEKKSANCCSSDVSEFNNPNVNSQNIFNNRSIQNSTLDNNILRQKMLFARLPPPSYSSNSAPIQSTQSCRFPYSNTTSWTVNQTSGQQFSAHGCNDYRQYFSQVQKSLESRSTIMTSSTYFPRNPLNTATYFPASNLLRQSLESSKVTPSTVTGSVTTLSGYPSNSPYTSASYASVIVNPASQRYSTDGQIPNTTHAKSQATSNPPLTEPVKKLNVGSIRVRNVYEMT
ncbi:uncharacterized protein isoform X2 [Leptinotarsa decemlineata]|uniref:uncharacterized protein isoform X2 n=1 Tax=Leptinotarsa decemlineata TaxID=7539 RepID=UPI003D30A012